MSMHQLLETLPQIGRVNWIGLRPERAADMTIVSAVDVTQNNGLDGDRTGSGNSRKRQVTLIQQEHLVAVGILLGTDPIDPVLTRRNLVISGINLLALKDQRFQIGNAILLGTGLCAPCSKMETQLGPGGYNAMRGHGGITARVIENGSIQIGDPVSLLKET